MERLKNKKLDLRYSGYMTNILFIPMPQNKILELEKSSQQQTQKVQREFEQMNRQISELQRAKSDLSSKLDQKESEFHQTSLKMEAMKVYLLFF